MSITNTQFQQYEIDYKEYIDQRLIVYRSVPNNYRRVSNYLSVYDPLLSDSTSDIEDYIKLRMQQPSMLVPSYIDTTPDIFGGQSDTTL